jgi:hypothetical protein
MSGLLALRLPKLRIRRAPSSDRARAVRARAGADPVKRNASANNLSGLQGLQNGSR